MKTLDVMERPPVEMEEAVYLPTDLSQWVGKPQLREWIVEEVESFNWDNPELTETLRRFPDFEPKALLSTLTLAYALGVFGSDDVVRICSRDPEFRPIRPKLPPRVEDFSTFRKLNRVLIQEILHQVTLRALKTQFVDVDDYTIMPRFIRRIVAENALERLNIARHIDRSAEL